MPVAGPNFITSMYCNPSTAIPLLSNARIA